ncbi:hypothetical protein NPIL_99401, partial [Nephila pilipes]
LLAAATALTAARRRIALSILPLHIPNYAAVARKHAAIHKAAQKKAPPPMAALPPAKP